MRLFSARPLLLLLLSLGLVAPLAAEQIRVPAEGQRAPHSRPAMEMPVKGMSKAQVEQAFGKPVKILPPVGEPPISRWVYDDYTVYFEHSHVIHSVVNR